MAPPLPPELHRVPAGIVLGLQVITRDRFVDDVLDQRRVVMLELLQAVRKFPVQLAGALFVCAGKPPDDEPFLHPAGQTVDPHDAVPVGQGLLAFRTDGIFFTDD